MSTRLPKFVHPYTDRHDKPRFYFRRRGFKSVPLPGLPWSPTFMAAYENALGGQAIEPGKGRHQPGTLNSFALSYIAAQSSVCAIGKISKAAN
jgi:hypothetical protein